MRGLYVENKSIPDKMSNIEKLKYGLLVHASTMAIHLVDFKREISHLWDTHTSSQECGLYDRYLVEETYNNFRAPERVVSFRKRFRNN